ncbi:MAG: D-alanyl-D-alanine carboxypeptidase, partial [Clostridia bacterium]|nr:D-alanyl-D-alanine carboxypeptidase [Clostridia bacterium]
MKRAIAFLLTAILAFGVCAVCFASYAKLPDPVYQWSSETGGAAGLLVAEADNGAVLYERNSSMEAKPGSLTVLMSALLLAEDTVEEEWDTPLDPLKSVNSTWSARAAQMGLKEGDTPTRRDLLYGMLLKGGADAAFTAAKLISGGETVFVEKMNEKAASLGMSGTRFENSCGLSSGMHYSNAHDMLILAAECMKHEEICEAFSSPAYACSGGVRGIELVNSNTAIGIEGCIGMKLGSDGGMENSLILLYERDGIKIITVLLEAASQQSAYSVSRELANEAFDHVANELGGREAVPTYAVCRTEKAISLYKE